MDLVQSRDGIFQRVSTSNYCVRKTNFTGKIIFMYKVFILADNSKNFDKSVANFRAPKLPLSLITDVGDRESFGALNFV